MFKVLIADSMTTIADRADPTFPRLNVTFVEYAQARGFVIDPARVRSPQDKPRVERTVTYGAIRSPLARSSTILPKRNNEA